MKYIEEADLVSGDYYICQSYFDSSSRLILKYKGEGEFTNGLSLYGDIRYVLEKSRINEFELLQWASAANMSLEEFLQSVRWTIDINNKKIGEGDYVV